MLTVAILINGNPVMARSSQNTGQFDEEGNTLYLVDDGSKIWHKREDGPVALARKLLDTIAVNGISDVELIKHLNLKKGGRNERGTKKVSKRQ
jgi:hypothetical protein